jgi:hypothetical protein
VKTLLCFLLAATLLPWAASESRARDIALSTSPVPLNSEAPKQRRVGPLIYRGGLSLSADDERFGGFSALLVSANGRRMLAASDKGTLFSAELGYDDDGNLIAAGAARLAPIPGPDGKPVAGRYRDAEALAQGADGAVFIAFEQHHRILRFAPPGQQDTDTLDAHALAAETPQLVAVPRELDEFNGNAAIEGLAALADGKLLVLTEGLDNERAGKPGWVLSPAGAGETGNAAGERAARFEFIRAPRFRPTGAARLPDGDILVLERRYTLIGGVAALLTRVPRERIGTAARLEGEEIARLVPPVTVDNMEGIAVRRDAAGHTLIYLISDDNFSILQRTLLLMFELAD